MAEISLRLSVFQLKTKMISHTPYSSHALRTGRYEPDGPGSSPGPATLNHGSLIRKMGMDNDNAYVTGWLYRLNEITFVKHLLYGKHSINGSYHYHKTKHKSNSV